jgi:hypothetical protein
VTLTASGGVAPYTFTLISGSLPAGVSLSSTGRLSGTPTAGGTYTFLVAATDATADSSDAQQYLFTVNGAIMSASPLTLPTGVSETAYSQTITATGGTAPYTYVVLGGALLPAGMSLNRATGTLSGTPTVSGTFHFAVLVTDSSTGVGPYSISKSYSLTVDAPTISVTPATLGVGAAGSAYSATLTASGGAAPYAFAITAGSLPAGLTLSSTGALAGTPTAAGTFNMTVTATDAGGFIGAQAYSLTVTAPTISVLPSTLSAGVGGSPYSQTITASGGTAPFTYAVTAGALPAGVSLSSSGTLSGAPSAGGTFTFSVTATDADGFTAAQGYSLSVAGSTITVTPSTLPGAVFGTSYSQILTASGGAGQYTFAVSSGQLPVGLSLTTGTLTGTPATNGSFTFTITATDADAFTGAQSYTIDVAVPATFSLTLSDSAVVAGATVQVRGTGLVPGSTVTLVLHSAPTTLGTTTATDGTFEFTATIPAGTAPGAHLIDATVINPGNSTTTAQAALTVTATLLSDTGANTQWPLLIGLLLLLVGAGCLWAPRLWIDHRNR